MSRTFQRKQKKNVEVPVEKDFFCESCVIGKMHRTPFPKSMTKTSEPGELVHADLCGPMQESSIGNSRFFLLLKDDFPHVRTVFFLKQKSEAKNYLRVFFKRCEKIIPRGVRTLRTNNGLEFINSEVRELTNSLGIRHEKTVPHSPEQNGAAERENRTVVEAARTLLFAKKLNTSLWAEAVNTVVHVLNRTGPSTVKEVTPHELWYGKSPDVTSLRTFGEEVFTHIRKEKRRKWDPKAEQGLLVGFDEETKGYRVWFKRENQIRVCRDVKFSGRQNNEEDTEDYTLLTIPKEDDTPKNLETPINMEESEQAEENEEVPDEEAPGEEEIQDEREAAPEHDDTPQADHATTFRWLPFGYNLRNRDTIQKPTRFPQAQLSVCLLSEIEEPRTYEEPVSSSDADSWR